MKISVLFMIVLAFLVACRFIGGERVDGNGSISTQERPLSDFQGVQSHGSFDVFVSSGPSYSVRVEADENLQEFIDLYVEDNVLKVTTKKRYNIRPSKPVKVHVTAPEYETIRSSGSGNIIGQNPIQGKRSMDIGIAGSGNIELNVSTEKLKADIAGSGSIKLAGSANDFDAETSGSGNIKAMELKTSNSEIGIAGSGNVEVFATDKLDVRIAGSGDVRYKGGAKLSSQVAGSGSVTNAD